MNEITRHVPAGDDDGLGPSQLAEHLRSLGKRTSAAARACWLPLILFGAIICGSLLFYEKLRVPATAGFEIGGTATAHVVKTEVAGLGYYWQIAILIGVVLTALWYRWHGSRAGLRTPARGFLITGLVLGELILLIPLLLGQARSLAISRLVHNTHQAGPLVIIAVLLWTLAWAERSRTLAIITGCFLVVALITTGLTNGGLIGGSTGAATTTLAAARLLGAVPGLILLIAGAVMWLRARQLRGRSGDS